MEFQEIFTCPFTTPTTCYSAPNPSNVHDSESVDLCNHAIEFANESHILNVNWAGEETNLKENRIHVELSSRTIPKDSPQLQCVGYSTWKDAQGHHEAMALIDPIHVNKEILFQDPDSPSRHLLQLSYSNRSDRDNDGVSVLSNADTSTNAARQHHRRISSTVSTITTSSMTGTVSSAASKPSAPHHQKTKSEISNASSINSTSDREGPSSEAATTGRHRQIASSGSMESIGADTAINSKKEEAAKSKSARRKANQLLRQSKARLVFSTTPAYTEMHEQADTSDNPTNQQQEQGKSLHALALLDYRPLCPCVAKWKIMQSEESQEMCGVFVGSADDSLLRFYVPATPGLQSLITIVLPEEHFTFDTPVMALDFCSVEWPERQVENDDEETLSAKTMYTLAVACQDGTIQLVTWEQGNDEEAFANISSHKVIVDGPLVCIKLHYNPTSSLRVIVGSLCGYVCQLSYNRNLPSWKGPFIVNEGLWNDYLDEEDSVLSIDVRDNYIAIGTQVGRCILYATRDNDKYFPVWYSLLPYCVHGIRIIQNDSLSANPERNVGMILSVTTRRSFLLFQALRGRLDLDPTAIKKRKESVDWDESLEEASDVEDEDNVATEETKSIVKDALGDIVNKVEENAQAGAGSATVDPPRDIGASTNASKAIDAVLDSVDLPMTASTNASNAPPQLPTPAAAPHLEYSSSEDGDEALSGTEDTLFSTTGDSQNAVVLTEGFEAGLGHVSQSEIPSDDQVAFVGDVSEIVETTTSSEEFVLVEAPAEEYIAKESSTP